MPPIITTNADTYPNQTNGWVRPGPGRKVFKSITLPQVAGLVPIFQCTNEDCRQGNYNADIIADDTKYPLQVFASFDATNQYENDSNSFLFELPQFFNGVLNFYLDKLVNGVWTKVANLNNDNYGKFYEKDSLCIDKDWRGYVIEWYKVWISQGPGMYRFRVDYALTPTGPSPEVYCFATPSFCLSEFNCYNADRTTKFEAYYSGGKLGDVSKSLSCRTSPFDYWEYCCCGSVFVQDATACKDQTFKAKPTAGDQISFVITTDTRTNPYIYVAGKYSNEVYDNGGNYNNTNWTYTAPCTGEYEFAGAFYGAIDSNHPRTYDIDSCIVMYMYIYDKNNNFIKKIGITSICANYGPALDGYCIERSCNDAVKISLNKGDKVKVAFEVYVLGTNTYPATVTINQSDQTSCGYFQCCSSVGGGFEPGQCGPVKWYDSIRVNGFFGREEKEYERNNIKYHTGIVNKIRDEAIRKFKWRSFGSTADNPGRGLPFWFHDRFSVYGLMADDLLVSDYNYNNSDYNLKRYCVQADGGYSPDYVGNSRYSNVTIDFKSKKQTLARNRCCS